jgi:predicted Co/Zn/Cd cation transporter (cation efflux family)
MLMEEQNYQNTQPVQTPPSGSENGLAIAGFVLGICAVVFIFLYAPIGIVMAIVGLVLSIMANKQSKSPMGTAGLVLNIVALALCVIVLLACTACIAAVTNPLLR